MCAQFFGETRVFRLFTFQFMPNIRRPSASVQQDLSSFDNRLVALGAKAFNVQKATDLKKLVLAQKIYSIKCSSLLAVHKLVLFIK